MIDLKDTCRIVETTTNGYGDNVVGNVADISCLFLQSIGQGHANNTEVIDSDAHIYLDPFEPFLLERGYRIEGCFIRATPFGTSTEQSWYKINRVVVGQRKLLENNVDNVHCFLTKTVKIEGGDGS